MMMAECTKQVNLPSYFYTSEGGLLSNPQILNCKNYDRVSANVAEEHFGKILSGKCEQSNPCPICKKRVTYYQADDELRQAIWQFLCSRLSPLTINKIQNLKNLIGNKVRAEAYPFSKGNFCLSDTGVYSSENYFAFMLKNKEENHEISSIYLIINNLNLLDSIFEIRLLLGVSNSKTFGDYLLKQNIEVLDQSDEKIISLFFSEEKSNLDGVIYLFHVLLSNNAFDEQSKELMIRYLNEVLGIMQIKTKL